MSDEMTGPSAPLGSRLRVRAFTPYPGTGPSTRFRLLQFEAPLAERGIDLRIDPFFTEDEYRRLYVPGRWLRKGALLGRRLLRRFRSLTSPEATDVALVHRELAPVGNGVLLRRLVSSRVPVVYDFDDAVFLPARGGNRLLGLLRRPDAATSAFCRAARCVLAGNAYLADYARRVRTSVDREAPESGPDPVRRLPTVIDTDRFRPSEAEETAPRPEPVVGWIGTHSTAPYLADLYPALERLAERVSFRLRVVSNRPPRPSPKLDIEYRPWRADREVAHVQNLDIGIYPLTDDPWSRGKCGFKAIQYLACGIPTVASPVGVLPEIVIPGETGWLADGADEWADRLERLIEDPEHRRELGRRGRAHVVSRYSVNAVVDSLAGALREADAGAGRVAI